MSDLNHENINIPENEPESSFNIKTELFKVLSYWKFFALTLLASLVIAFLYLRYTKPIYKVSCTILIKDDSKTKLANNNIISELDVFKQQSNVQNEIGIIQSKSLSRRTVEEAGLFVSYYTYTSKLNRKIELFDDCPFRILVDTSHIQLLNTPVQIKFMEGDSVHYSVIINDFTNSNQYIFSKTITTPASEATVAPVDAAGKINDWYTNAFFSFKLIKNPDYIGGLSAERNYFFLLGDPYSIGETYAYSLAADKIDKDASIIEISMETTLPSKAAKFLNALSENYINLDLEYKNLTATKTIDFIDEQLGQITDSLHNVENILANFRVKNKTMNLSTEYEAIITKLETQDNEKVKANIEIKYYEYILGYLDTHTDYIDIISPSFLGVSNEMLNTLVTELITLSTEKNKLAISSTENNPYYTNIETNITSTKKALLEQIKNSLSLAQLSLKDINKRITESEATINKLPGTEKDLLTIQRKFDLNDETYSYLLEKKAEASIAKASNLSNNAIVDPAELVGRVYPKSTSIYFIALLIGLILPYLIIRLREYFNDTIQDKKDIETYSRLPIIGTIAHSNYPTTLVVIDKPRSMVSETIRAAKANMDFISPKRSNIITVTSTFGGEGKTFCSINLSCSYAVSDFKTVLIGADLRRPRIFNDFSLTNTKGLTSSLIGKSSLNEIISNTHIENLHIITAGPIPPNPAELLGSEKMKELMEELRKTYDCVIIDTPPLGIVTDALFLMKHADINIYITRYNYSSKKVLKDVNDMVKTTGIKNVCFLLNDIPYKINKYSKYGRYSQKYGYSYSYSEGYYED
jgi:tyrosine-protein kinase Etk/Wzc